ncbi:MAG: FkbM family methyltransferase [Bacteroidota bacterium]|nr:FkbM family methyltransferase [Bacteroidota bacterium]
MKENNVTTRDAIWNRLLKAEAKARSSKTGRWRQSPVMYPALMAFNYLLYPIVRRGVYTMAYPFFGLPMRTLLPAGTDLLLNRIKSHDSELRLAKFMCLHLLENDIVIDVGAHYGYYSLLASVLAGNGKVFSIEASSSSYDILIDNTRGRSNVVAFHQAAGEKNGKVVFYEYPGPYAEYNTTIEGAYEKQTWLKKIVQTITTVPVIMLDDLIEAQNINKAFIKIDVEGGEPAVLKGLKRSLLSCDLTIAMEYLSNKGDDTNHAIAADILSNAGYESYAIEDDGQLKLLKNIDHYLQERKITSDNIVFVRSS